MGLVLFETSTTTRRGSARRQNWLATFLIHTLVRAMARLGCKCPQ